MHSILCYGDSNTFGFNPLDGSRYKKSERWSGILSDILGEQYKVIEEGCNNRTMFFKNSAGGEYSGCEYFKTCLKKYANIDFFVLALGINDTQFFYNADELTFEKGLLSLINDIHAFYENAKILVLAPSVIQKNILNSFFAQMFDKTSIDKSKVISDVYRRVADEQGCFFIDLNKIVQTSNIDGLHYDVAAHWKIAEAVAEVICNLFEKQL